MCHHDDVDSESAPPWSVTPSTLLFFAITWFESPDPIRRRIGQLLLRGKAIGPLDHWYGRSHVMHIVSSQGCSRILLCFHLVSAPGSNSTQFAYCIAKVEYKVCHCPPTGPNAFVASGC